jgi:integrase
MNFRRVLWTGYKRTDGTCDVKIYVRTPEGKKYYSTGIKIEEHFWKKSTGEVRSIHPLAELYNSQINALKMELEQFFRKGGSFSAWEDRKRIGDGAFIPFLEDFISEAHKGRHGLSKGSIKVYDALLKRIKELAAIQGKRDFKFSEIDNTFLDQFWKMLLNQGCSMTGGVGKHTKCLKRVMKVAQEKGLHENEAYKSFKVHKLTHSEKIYLSEQEINLIEKVTLPNNIDKERIRFLIAYYFLLRFSDVIRIRRSHFFENDNKYFFRIKHQKTKKEVVIPVKPKALELLEKVDYKLDYSANQIANCQIKYIAAMAGVNEEVNQGNERSPKSNFVTFHTARRSAATNLYLSGVSTKLIADLGGWTNEKTLRLYLRASGLDSARMASDLEFFK